jgi:hypothetical protein
MLGFRPNPSVGVPKACQKAFILVHFDRICLHHLKNCLADPAIEKSLSESELGLVAGAGFEPATFRL